MLADYHRTRPLLNGEVKAKGIKLQPRRAETGEACLRPVYEEFDIAEMSLSWYMMARCRNEPVIALPIFPLRMQIHPYIFCSTASGIERPEDLKGKKIGMDEYRLTVGLWARGILQEEVASRVVCKFKGLLTPVLIEMVKHRKDNSLKTLRMSHDPHRSSPSSHFTKGSFD
jgi:hypothetical protein